MIKTTIRLWPHTDWRIVFTEGVKMQKCKVCKTNDATGPKIVGGIRNGQNLKALRTLLMCDNCYKKFKDGEISLNIIDDSKKTNSTR